MKRFILLSIPMVLVLATACDAVQSEPEQEAEMSEKVDISYAIGWQTGRSFEQQKIEVDASQFAQGLEDGLGEGEPRWTEQEMMAAMQTFQQELMAQQQAQAAEQGSANESAGAAFLAENGSREGVMTTESGLQYEVISQGDGPSPAATDRVSVHYVGTLLDGTEFDSSVKRGTPASFGLNQVIPGWTEGLQLMSVGSKYKLYVPANLGYGPSGQGPIGPNSTLIFEVELLEILSQ